MGEPEPVTSDRDPIEPDEQAIALRALDFSKLPNAGTNAENWERALGLSFNRVAISSSGTMLEPVV